MTLFRWLTVINDRISAIIIVPTNVKLAIAMYLKSKCPNFQASFWETIASLDEINPLTGRLIQIARDGKITDDEIKDFAFISHKLDKVSVAIDALNLWVNKTASENNINIDMLNIEKEKLDK